MDKNGKHLNQYLAHLKNVQFFSDHTVKAYRQDIQQFFDYMKNNKLQISKDNIRDFISDIFLRQRNKATVSRKIYAIRSYFAYLQSRGEIEKNPFDGIRSPKVEKKLPQILTEKEMIDFLDRIPGDGFLNSRNKALFEMLYATGLRVSEIANLKQNDIDMKERLIRVLGKGKKERIVPFNKTASDALLTYLDEKRKKFGRMESVIFVNYRGTKISERSIERILEKLYLETSGSVKKVYPHLFRHSFASHLLQRGANLRVIQELLGHSNLTTTEVYTSLNYSDLLKTYMAFHPRSGGEGE